MLRFLARFLGFWLVAAALVTAVVDGAKSIAASALVATPLAESWATIVAMAGSGDDAAAASATAATSGPLAIALAWLFAAPTLLVLAVPGVALLIIGARRRRYSIGREFAT